MNEQTYFSADTIQRLKDSGARVSGQSAEILGMALLSITIFRYFHLYEFKKRAKWPL